MIYHVAKTGNDNGCGSGQEPFLTIQRAAREAFPGDTVIVHEGEYREWVRPTRGGISDSCRIVYTAASGEHVVIKGSERIDCWECLPDPEQSGGRSLITECSENGIPTGRSCGATGWWIQETIRHIWGMCT